MEVLDDIAQVWARYAENVTTDRRCTLLLAGSVDTPALDVGNATRIDLADFPQVRRWYEAMMARPGVSRGFSVALS